MDNGNLLRGRMMEEAEEGGAKSVRFAGEAASDGGLDETPNSAREAASSSVTASTSAPPSQRAFTSRSTCPDLEEMEDFVEARARLAEVAVSRKVSAPGPSAPRPPPRSPRLPSIDSVSSVPRSLTSPSISEAEALAPAQPPPPSSKRPPRALPISPAQASLVRKSWANAKTRGKLEPIANLFHHALFKCPEMRLLLDRPVGSLGLGGGGGGLAASASATAGLGLGPAAAGTVLKEHVLMFLELFEGLMETLEDPREASEELRTIGRAHVGLWEAGFRAAHFDVLAQSLLDATLKWGEKSNRTGDCQKAWAEICAFVVEELKEGFHHARKFSKRKASLKAF